MSRKTRQSRRQTRKQRDRKPGRLLEQAQRAHQSQDLERAKDIYQQVLEFDPANVAALHGLGRIAQEIGMLDTAVEFYNAALETDPASAPVIKSLALLFTRQNRIEQAIELYCNLLQLNPVDADACGELARLHLLAGNMVKALEYYNRAFALDPSDPRNVHGLLQLDSQSITPEIIGSIEAQLQQPDLALDKRSSFYFALGAIHDSGGRYDEAFANYTVANLAKPMAYDAQAHSDLITRIIDTCTPELFNRHAEAGRKTFRPVFIVGMPRSGTTLVEQILASHPDVYAAGELNHIQHLVDALSTDDKQQLPYPQILDVVSSDDIRHMSESMERLISSLATNDELRVTDKMPLNFLHLGLIALLFPNAHIIHCRRNPLDTCLSCYFQNFSGNHAYAGDLENLGHYYRQYERLMLHWYKVLPVPVHTVDYEKLIDNPESVSRQLLAYSGLEWHDDCLKFHQTRRHVHTASLVQVRQPLYRSSVSRWRHYDKFLHTLKSSLGNTDSVQSAVDDGLLDSRKSA